VIPARQCCDAGIIQSHLQFKAMTAPRISVLIPTCNYARFLPEAIESVLEQDFRDFEVLISDDCSADDSREVICRYAARDSRIRFKIHDRNLGMVQNWNWCLSEARGEYVKFLFGDDRLACPEALSQLVRMLDANPSAAMAVSPRYVIDEFSNVLGRSDDLGKPGLHVGTRVIAQCLVQNRNLIGEPSAVLIRKSAASRGFNVKYRQLVDQEMWFYLLEDGDLEFAPKPLCCFRKHGRQQTVLNTASRVGESESYQLLMDYADKPYLYAGERRRSIAACLYHLRKAHRNGAAHLNRVQLENLTARLGIGWYRAYWVRRRIVRPFQNLGRWYNKVRSGRIKPLLASSPGGKIPRSSLPPAANEVQRHRRNVKASELIGNLSSGFSPKLTIENQDGKEPAFSVIMPVWNRAHRIETAIESVLAQTFQDFELIIVDDGSEDGLAQAVRRFLGPKIRYIRMPHRGVSAARNAGIRETTGRYVAYLDSDNTWRPGFLERIKNALDGDASKRQVAYTMAEIHECNGMPHPAGLKTVGEPLSLRKLIRQNQVDQNAIVHSRRCMELVGEYDESLRRFVDWEFLARLAARFEPIFIPEVLVDYNWGLEKNAISLTEEIQVSQLKVSRKIAKTLKMPGKISIRHDMTDYFWDDLPDEKYDNWLRVRSGPYDLRTFHPTGYPFMLQIEPTSRCNLRCPLCPVGRDELGRPKRDMTLSEFKGIIDDVRRWVMLLVLWDWGEPFANPELPQIVRYASDAGMRTVTSTNAHYLSNDDQVAAILSSGLSTLIVAIDSIDDAEYRAYRIGGQLEKAITGLKKVVALKRALGSHTLINLRMVAMRQNEHQIGEMRRLAREIGADRFTVKTLNPSCGSVSMDSNLVPLNKKLRRFKYVGKSWERIPVKVPCHRVATMSNILSNGDVVPCCYDFDASMKVGNAFETPFSHIWVSPEYREIRHRIHEQRDELPRCSNCHINFQLSRTGWFAAATDLTAVRPFWDPRRYLNI
jgi:radical SAM protein with 4Fe4S-binding SPASM domain